MEEGCKKREAFPPQLLNLIPDEREWKVREAGGSVRSRSTAGLGAEEAKKLELKLGLPGVLEEEVGDGKKHQESPALSVGYFPKHSKLSTTGAKRGFLDTVEARREGYNEQKGQGRAGCGKELSLGEQKIAAGERKKGCCCPPPPQPPPPSHACATAPLHSSSSSNHPQGRAASVPVVGWPPIRSFRRNLASSSSSSKQSPEPQNGEADDKAKLTCKKRLLVKINMDGIPIGRKVDLAACDGYDKLSSAVEELFRGFLEAQSSAPSAEQGEQDKIFSRLLDGTGEYTLVYEDNEGDRVLVADVPWNVFVSTAKRLRVLRSSELAHGQVGAASRRAANC